MNKTIFGLIKLCISGIVSVFLLSLFCLIFNYSGCHVTNKENSTDYKWEKSQWFSTMKEGYAWFRLDKNGFNNINDTSFEERSVDILLMGSSHMEARQINPNENAGALLNEYLPEYRTYNIGISGHTIYTCVKNMSAAYNQYKPSKYVIIETSDVNLDIDKMNQVINNSYSRIPSYDHGMVYKIQKTIPAVKVMYKSVTDWKSASLWHSAEPEPSMDNKNDYDGNPTDNYVKVLSDFLSYAKKSIQPECKLIIFYHPATQIDENGEFVREDNKYLDCFVEQCNDKGIIFIDETDNFENLYKSEHVLAHGFINTAIGTGHLNKYGHQVIAKSLYNAIMGIEEEEK